MLSACAAKGNHHFAFSLFFAFVQIPRKQAFKGFEFLLHFFFLVQKGNNGGIKPREGTQLLYPIRIGNVSTIQNQIRIVGNAVFVTETLEANRERNGRFLDEGRNPRFNIGKKHPGSIQISISKRTQGHHGLLFPIVYHQKHGGGVVFLDGPPRCLYFLRR